MFVFKNRYGKTGSALLGVIGDRCSILNEPDIALSEIKQINNTNIHKQW